MISASGVKYALALAWGSKAGNYLLQLRPRVDVCFVCLSLSTLRMRRPTEHAP